MPDPRRGIRPDRCAGRRSPRSAFAQMDAAAARPRRSRRPSPASRATGPTAIRPIPSFRSSPGRSWRYIYIQLKDFKEGRRNDPVMSPMAADLSRDDMIALGNFFAAQKPAPIAFKADGARGRGGQEDLRRGAVPDVPSRRLRRPERDSAVAGQYPDTSGSSSRTSRRRRRTNDAGNMTSVAGTLSDDDIENLRTTSRISTEPAPCARAVRARCRACGAAWRPLKSPRRGL